MENQTLDAEDSDQDDFAKVYRLSYPEFIFGNDDSTEGDVLKLISPGDRELLTPLIMAIYAVAMNAQNTNFASVNIDDVNVNMDRLEYTVRAYIDDTVIITYAAWSTLINLSPGRLRRIGVSCYYHPTRLRTLMKLEVVFKSERAPLVSTFANYQRYDLNIVLSRAQPILLGNGSNLVDALGQGQGHTPAQATEAVRQYTDDRIADLKRACSRYIAPMIKGDGGAYNVDANFVVTFSEVHLNRGIVTWSLPPGCAFNVMELVRIRSELPSFIIDASVGIRSQPSLRPNNSAGPFMQIVVRWIFIPFGIAPVSVVDSNTWLFFSESNTAKNEKLVIPMSGQPIKRHVHHRPSASATSLPNSRKRKRPHAMEIEQGYENDAESEESLARQETTRLNTEANVFALLAPSDDEDESPAPPTLPAASNVGFFSMFKDWFS